MEGLIPKKTRETTGNIRKISSNFCLPKITVEIMLCSKNENIRENSAALQRNTGEVEETGAESSEKQLKNLDGNTRVSVRNIKLPGKFSNMKISVDNRKKRATMSLKSSLSTIKNVRCSGHWHTPERKHFECSEMLPI